APAGGRRTFRARALPRNARDPAPRARAVRPGTRDHRYRRRGLAGKSPPAAPRGRDRRRLLHRIHHARPDSGARDPRAPPRRALSPRRVPAKNAHTLSTFPQLSTADQIAPFDALSQPEPRNMTIPSSTESTTPNIRRFHAARSTPSAHARAFLADKRSLDTEIFTLVRLASHDRPSSNNRPSVSPDRRSVTTGQRTLTRGQRNNGRQSETARESGRSATPALQRRHGRMARHAESRRLGRVHRQRYPIQEADPGGSCQRAEGENAPLPSADPAQERDREAGEGLTRARARAARRS